MLAVTCTPSSNSATAKSELSQVLVELNHWFVCIIGPHRQQLVLTLQINILLHGFDLWVILLNTEM